MRAFVCVCEHARERACACACACACVRVCMCGEEGGDNGTVTGLACAVRADGLSAWTYRQVRRVKCSMAVLLTKSLT